MYACGCHNKRFLYVIVLGLIVFILVCMRVFTVQYIVSKNVDHSYILKRDFTNPFVMYSVNVSLSVHPSRFNNPDIIQVFFTTLM